MISVTLALVLTLAAAAPRPQAPPFTPSANPVTDAARAQLARESKNLIAAAELLPADKYTYQPTPAQMTFGDLIAHIVQTNFAVCSAASGTPAPMSPPELKKIAGVDGKDSLVAAMKKSFDYCTESFAKLQDSALTEEAVFFGQKTGMSRANALLTIVVDWADHYSTAASYLRLNGVLPPTAQPKK
jgi:uncharacterized damage-inducible protein DinB